MNETGLRRTLPDQTSGSGHTFDTSHHPSVTNTILSKRVCFYKSGDPQFSGLRVVINNRTFKTFDALLDSLSKKVPLPFGVRNITTPRGIHGINALDELEDGKSYICSDTRKVKPIDLALARRRLPPWYHARPVSSRHRTARLFPGRKNIHRDGIGVIRTPKKLVVFRNGEPSNRHVVVLHKKTTPNYESILGHISELMQFHVSKLHTPDGRRIDGLPGLILCSGSVVAVGREPFRPAVYGAAKSQSPTRRPTKQRAYKRQKTSVSKKMTPSFSSKSRNFSASSERYIVHQIHNSVGESSCDLPINSIESGSDRILESLAKTEEDTCLSNGNCDEGQDSVLPNDDNIEKSFRVNQDGSMTVEMKVRLTIKEEETVHWTTTLTRSVVADQADVACLPDPEQEICSNHSQTSATSTDIVFKDRTTDGNDDDPPSLGNGVVSDTFQDEDEDKDHNGSLPLSRRAPTPGCKKISKLRASVESIKSVTVDEIGEGKTGSYIFREETENRTITEQFYMENQNRTKPVPKPRRHGSEDSSLSFSYDSSGVITTEPEGSRVRSIREMFLARSDKDIQQSGFLSPNLSEQRGETSGSGGYQSQTSSDLSGAEDDSARKSISKGYVRRAIEMLYGIKDLEPEEGSERPLSEPDQTKREPSNIFSPFHAARSKAMSELSYFNSSTALDIFTEATKCIAFNAQVGPGDSVPIDNGRWLLRENTSMRKSISDPAGINKAFTNTFHLDELHKDTIEKTPYSLFSAKPELEDETKSQPGKCTYFSLPHASESEVYQEEMSTVSKSSKTEDSDEETKDASEKSKTWAERNGTLPSIGVADFKMKDNKVHPLVELPSDGEVVVVQPGKGRVVNRRIQEPDVLDLLYSFCGEHCPIL
ncbi:oxygen-regulated protein 1 [Gambusia affinis]|uniref:oxygen-regulated protein 1 n=1 Tax=Gambusia affinis TaxID=33528 RepID=UPI001CDD517C|nr:oxygen-regulated protein 1 [Gambusia affinis]